MRISSSMNASSVVCHDAAEVVKTMAPVDFSFNQYLLKDGSVSSHPVYNQETGVFVNPSLVMDLHISKSPMTVHMAKLFYKLVDKSVPSMFQVLLLQMNHSKVEKRLADIGMSGAIDPYPLESVWYKEALENAKPNESRWVITFQPREGFYEPECDCLSVWHTGTCAGEDTVRQFLIGRKVLLELDKGNFYPRHFDLLGGWNNFDLLTFSSSSNPNLQWLFFRRRDTFDICHYIVGNKEYRLNFLSDDLYEFDHAIYQAADNKIVRIHSLDLYDYANFGNGKLCLTHDAARDCDGIGFDFVESYYVKGEDGLYTKQDN